MLVDDLDRADARTVDLGARRLTDGAVVHEDESFRVYADPAGHPFCLIEQAAPDLRRPPSGPDPGIGAPDPG